MVEVPLNFGFSAKRINRKVLAEATQFGSNPSHGFLSAVFRGVKAPWEGRLMAVMNPAEILGVAAGFTYAAARHMDFLFQRDLRHAGLYSGMLEAGKECYQRQIEKLDDISFDLKVRPHRDGTLHERLSAVKLPSDVKDIGERAEEYLRDFKFIYDTYATKHATGNTVRHYSKWICDSIERLYEEYSAQIAKEKLDAEPAATTPMSPHP